MSLNTLPLMSLSFSNPKKVSCVSVYFISINFSYILDSFGFFTGFDLSSMLNNLSIDMLLQPLIPLFFTFIFALILLVRDLAFLYLKKGIFSTYLLSFSTALWLFITWLPLKWLVLVWQLLRGLLFRQPLFRWLLLGRPLLTLNLKETLLGETGCLSNLKIAWVFSFLIHLPFSNTVSQATFGDVPCTFLILLR